ncbi:MAG: asparagine synthase (glutamine-hydrolyzing) [Pelagibacteraceae bacterium]|nr:asparagine synthase (glutamine-hydrolyzing) [Pelagibacteraceae bacterium]
MCGICGIINKNSKKVSLENVKIMAKMLHHRGPNDEGYFIDDNIGLGFKRLSIIDIANGAQPMFSDDKSVTVVFNGEIYNYQTLRHELKKNGVIFKTNSDTEVVLKSYIYYGLDFIEKLRGMFAIAILDKNIREIILVRDRLGKKPLFYHNSNKRFSFSSEMKSLLKLDDIDRDISLKSLDQFVAFGYVPGSDTIVNSIKRVEPGNLLRYSYKNDEYEIVNYWTPKLNKRNKIPNQSLDKIIGASVKLRMISDVPLGAFLSGGIDSSIVVALMSKYSNVPVKTFTVGFEEQEFNELPLSRIVAKRYRTEHHEYVLKPDIKSILPDIVWYADEPFGDSSALPTYFLAKMAAQEVTVALNGDGADEVFGGYDRYKAILRVLKYKSSPALARIFLKNIIKYFPQNNYFNRIKKMVAFSEMSLQNHYMDKMMIKRRDARLKLYTDDTKHVIKKNNDNYHSLFELDPNNLNSPLARIMINDLLNYLPGDLLVKMDRMSMANSLEVRSPFLDHNVVEAASHLDDSEKLLWYGPNKRFLRKTYGQMIPNEILNRPKTGFGIPVSEWLRGPLYTMSNDILLSSIATNRGYFNTKMVSKILDEHKSIKKDHSNLIWSLMMLELWFKNFIDNK